MGQTDYKAQLEAARRQKSDWKYNLGGCKSCTNLRKQHPVRKKLSKITTNFGRFCPPKFCWEQPFQN